jgi:hypothetical protein
MAERQTTRRFSTGSWAVDFNGLQGRRRADDVLETKIMKTLLIAAVATVAAAAFGSAVPASAHGFDHTVRYDHSRRERVVDRWELRRLEEQRRIEWLRHHRFHDSGFGFRR